MNQQKQDTYELAMFPTLLQALYNARITIGSVMAKKVHTVDKGECIRKTFDDISFVIETMKAVGIKRRYGKRKVSEKTSELVHVSDVDEQKLIEMFNPDIIERDAEIDDICTKYENTIADLRRAIEKRNNKISELEGKVHSERIGRKLAEEIAERYIPSDMVGKKLSAIISDDSMTKDEINNELKGILGRIVL